jgi:hypothetical protein
MIYGNYITHDGAVEHMLIKSPYVKRWAVDSVARRQGDDRQFEIQWCDDEWHARARFERLVADDITAMQEKEL